MKKEYDVILTKTESFRLFLKSLLVESVFVLLSLNLMLVLMLLVLELQLNVRLMENISLSTVLRNGLPVVVGQTIFLLLYKQKRVCLCFLLNVAKELRLSRSRHLTHQVLVLLMLHLKM